VSLFAVCGSSKIKHRLQNTMPQNWTCSGVAKDGQQHPNQEPQGSHEPYDNYGPYCVMCNLTKEQVVGGGSKPSAKVIAIPIVLGIVAAFGVGIWAFVRRSQPIPQPIPPLTVSVPPTASTSPTATVSPLEVTGPSCSTDKLVKKSGNLFGAIEVGSTGVKGKVIQELATLNEDGSKLVLFRKEKIDDRNVTAIEPNSKSASIDIR
jgi:hypothetical protein